MGKDPSKDPFDEWHSFLDYEDLRHPGGQGMDFFQGERIGADMEMGKGQL
jgi:hypothetical protein